MNLDLNDDQIALQQGIEQMVARFRRALPIGSAGEYVVSAELEHALVESGFLDIGRQDGMGALEAALLVEEVAKLPFASEVAASAMVAPQLSLAALPRPLVLARAPLSTPLRFLTPEATILVDCGEVVRVLDGRACEIVPAKGPFAYPYGKIITADLAAAPVLANVAPAAMRQWWQVALCFEVIGAAQAAFDLTVEYVKTRKQFGKPIGTFQSIQHRLSECAVLLAGARIMARRAAWSGAPGDAALAAGYCQDVAQRLATETHQFHGAIGLTLEYPLHHWTYRLRILQGELGGSSVQYGSAAGAIWPGQAA